MNNWHTGTRNDDRNDDKPPFSRVFVVCNKQLRVEDLRSAFVPYGHLEDIHLPKDRNTGESKGIAYIKYSKTSSAALAIQEMHLKTIQNSSKPIRVMVATHKSDNHNNNEEKYKRLFIKVSKEATEAEVKEHFSQFGHVESVHLQKDKFTDECRGFAYVHYNSFLDAAKAYEGCDRKYKPIFATPKDELKRGRHSVENYIDSFHSSNSNLIRDNYSDHYSQEINKRDSLTSLIKSKSQDYDTINVTCTPQVPQKYIEKLFNLITGMTQFKYITDSFNGCSKAIVSYDSDKAAAYAVERLNNFEFPSGEIITVKPEDNAINKAANNLTHMIVNSLKNSGDNNTPDLLQLADVIVQASTLLKAATAGQEMKTEVERENYCSVSLPPPQPLANINSRVAQRCFLVFKPVPPPLSLLKDVFSRFGDLIDVSTFPNKTFGFAKYASVKAAQNAMKTLHGASLYGTKMKVLEADEKPSKDDKMNVEDEVGVDHDIDRKRIKLHDEQNSNELT